MQCIGFTFRENKWPVWFGWRMQLARPYYIVGHGPTCFFRPVTHPPCCVNSKCICFILSCRHNFHDICYFLLGKIIILAWWNILQVCKYFHIILSNNKINFYGNHGCMGSHRIKQFYHNGLIEFLAATSSYISYVCVCVSVCP